MGDTGRKTLLLVEDEFLIAAKEKLDLEREGFLVLTAGNGNKAIEIMSREGSRIDLVLMDIDLGSGMDGTEAAREILASHAVPVIFLSSHTEREIVEKTERITSYGYVVKNSGITVLVASIKMAFRLFEAHRKLSDAQSELTVLNEEMQVAYEELSTTNQNLLESQHLLIESEAAIKKRLDAVLDPDGDVGDLKLSDIIDVAALTSMMEDFYSITGYLSAILELDGKVLVSIGWQDICTKFHRVHPDSCANCRQSDTALTTDVPFGTFRTYRCLNNMWDMVTPIEVAGRHVGNLFIGQFIYDDEVVDEEVFRAQARRYGFDEEAYLEALRRVPRFSREAVDRAMSFYAKLAGMISRMSFATIKLARSLAQKEKAEEQSRRLLAEKALILREVHHRVKNNMRVMISGLLLQADRSADSSAQPILLDMAARAQSMALLYDRLYRSDNVESASLRDYLPSLLEEIVRIYPCSAKLGVASRVDDIPLDTARLSALGILVNELATNAIKHAFPGRDEGRLELSVARMDGRIWLEFGDDGIGISGGGEGTSAGGFGLQLVEGLAAQLGGSIARIGGPGTRFRLEFQA